MSGDVGYLITRLAMVGLVLFLACIGARADVLYHYTFSNAGYANSYFPAPEQDTATLSGTFTWDATTNSITASNIDLSGFDGTGGDPGDFGPFSCTNCTTGHYDSGAGRYFAVNLGTQEIYITFANSLSLGADDPLSLSAPGGGYGGFNDASFQDGYPFTSVSGTANVTPEPGSLTLLATGLLGLGSMMRRRRNRQ